MQQRDELVGGPGVGVLDGCEEGVKRVCKGCEEGVTRISSLHPHLMMQQRDEVVGGRRLEVVWPHLLGQRVERIRALPEIG